MPRVQPHSAPTAAHLAPPSRTLMGAFFRLRLHRSTWTVAKSIFPSYVSSRCSNSISSAVFSWQRGRQVDARAVSAGAQRGEQEREQAIGGGALGLASRSCARSPSHQSLHCASHRLSRERGGGVSHCVPLTLWRGERGAGPALEPAGCCQCPARRRLRRTSTRRCGRWRVGVRPRPRSSRAPAASRL
jgi:hypothetical protein